MKTGTVKFFNVSKGFGFIKNTLGNEFFFHKSALKNINFNELEEGQEVEFEESEGERQGQSSSSREREFVE